MSTNRYSLNNSIPYNIQSLYFKERVTMYNRIIRFQLQRLTWLTIIVQTNRRRYLTIRRKTQLMATKAKELWRTHALTPTMALIHGGG